MRCFRFSRVATCCCVTWFIVASSCWVSSSSSASSHNPWRAQNLSMRTNWPVIARHGLRYSDVKRPMSTSPSLPWHSSLAVVKSPHCHIFNVVCKCERRLESPLRSNPCCFLHRALSRSDRGHSTASCFSRLPFFLPFGRPCDYPVHPRACLRIRASSVRSLRRDASIQCVVHLPLSFTKERC